MSVLFLENDDSFSWNVLDALPIERRDVRVHEVRRHGLSPELLSGMDAVVIGPGPMDPERAGLVSFVRLLAARAVPTLGVCLGHQALGAAFGAKVVRLAPVHGKRSIIRFERARLFPGFEGPLTVMRYHSLALAALPAELRVVARTADGVPMAIEHAALPMAGVQFHPDSYATERGRELFAACFAALLPDGPARA